MPLPPDAPPEVQQAAWQIASLLHRAQDDARQDLLASIKPLHAVLTEQRRRLDQRHATVTDPEQLEDVVAIDHTNAMALRAARRARALAGAPWPRGRANAVPLLEVARGAQCAIAHYQRVHIGPSDAALAVPGAVVEPLLAAIAELLDNAVRAAAQVDGAATMTVERTAQGAAAVTITDPGPGMDDLTLAQALALLRHRPPLPTPTSNRPLGLRTVALACAAGGFRAELDSVPGIGTHARLHLPAAAVQQPSPVSAAEPGTPPTPTFAS
ncbi:ATP-binding protein [Streptomyces sp. NRRL S-350]|uniref:ATP-binding protein n=1 Tax=Streptomyces sp. NRRL S-350 TaxID=1463902 RepID=UPI0004C1547B|nr:ATP-binding protein [Streptomyces sp. NRRL S-350]